MANVKTYSLAKNGGENIQPNFKVREFRCKDGSDRILIDKEMTFILQYIRNRLGPITINSAYRTDSYNKKVGGASNSYHKYGRAFDITNSSKQLTAISNIAYTLGVKGIIKYGSFVHIDSRENPYYANSNGTRINYSHYNIPYDKVCRFGSKDLETALIQFKLKSLKYDVGIVDGIYGQKTHDAVVQYQKNVGFKGKDVDGVVGQMTWNKLFN
jgi:hypothetical protein